jgi:hypothetical protein
VKTVLVLGTDMYSKQWAGGSSDWYSVVGEVICLSVFDVNC